MPSEAKQEERVESIEDSASNESGQHRIIFEEDGDEFIVKREENVKTKATRLKVENSLKYCRSCKKTFRDRGSYRRHIRRRHMPDPDIEPDFNDPNFYCQSCNTLYADKKRFHAHIRDTHFMHLSNKPAETDTKTYCDICKFQYLNRSSYRSHLVFKHRIDFGGRKIRDRNSAVKPNPNDPNFYCRSCKFTYSSKNSFHNHLRSIHNMSKRRTDGSLSEHIELPSEYRNPTNEQNLEKINGDDEARDGDENESENLEENLHDNREEDMNTDGDKLDEVDVHMNEDIEMAKGAGETKKAEADVNQETAIPKPTASNAKTRTASAFTISPPKN